MPSWKTNQYLPTLMCYGINSKLYAQNVLALFINLKNKKKPWISQHIRCLSRKKQRLYNLAKLSQAPNHWQAYYKLKKEVSNMCRTAYNNYVLTLAENGHITKKNYGLTLKVKESGIPPLSQNQLLHTDPHQKAEILNNYFFHLFSVTKNLHHQPWKTLLFQTLLQSLLTYVE